MATSARRRRWVWLGLLPALVVLAVLTVRWLLEPERLSAFLLRQASQATGLQFTLDEPAGVGFWPDLHLELTGLAASAPGATAPLLRVERADVVLPWSALNSDSLEIRSLRLHRPQLDWAATQAWLATRTRGDAPFVLPRIDAAVEVTEGEIAGAGWRVADLSLRLPALRAGEATTLALAGRYVSAGAASVSSSDAATEPVGVPFDLTLRATPRQSPQGLQLDDVELALTSPAAASLRGSAMVGDAPAITLTGELPSWPATWPALPLPSDGRAAPPDSEGSAARQDPEGSTASRVPQRSAASQEPVRVALEYRDGTVRANLARGDAAIDIDITPGDIAAWRDDPAAPLLPPLTGSARAERLQFGGVELRGVELRVEDDDAEP